MIHIRRNFDSMFGCVEMEDVAWHIYSQWMQDKELYPVFSIYAFPDDMLVGVALMLSEGWMESAAPENQEFTVSLAFVARVYARLIAAAPELLAACKAVAAALERIQQDGSVVWLHGDDCAVHESASERLEWVIAKAEKGGAP
jgi:hypothetical protein